ncbi:ribonuclease p protein component [Gigaspora margarita]|uniref:Ribonuclease p protein component n=1 Tax=Gigaspora margarita TaxID=4874 RepID=A0A8H4A373_GIGMA|nr:ribonuclease p protein component [Gigaspora margarita]
MLNFSIRQRITTVAVLIFNQNNKRWLVSKGKKPTESKETKGVTKPPKPVPYLLLKDTHSIDDDTLRGIMTNRTFPRIRNDLFTLIVRPWRENDTYYTKKSREIITTYRLQTVVSKKLVSKLATVRNRIKRRIREAARYALPSVGRVRKYLVNYTSTKIFSRYTIFILNLIDLK